MNFIDAEADLSQLRSSCFVNPFTFETAKKSKHPSEIICNQGWDILPNGVVFVSVRIGELNPAAGAVCETPHGRDGDCAV